jgi:hypothetical protein
MNDEYRVNYAESRKGKCIKWMVNVVWNEVDVKELCVRDWDLECVCV